MGALLIDTMVDTLTDGHGQTEFSLSLALYYLSFLFMSNTRLFSFVASNNAGEWRVTRIEKVKGEKTVEPASFISILPSSAAHDHGGIWSLKGVTSNARYESVLLAQVFLLPDDPISSLAESGTQQERKSPR